MTTTVLLTGGTGTLGQRVLPRLIDTGAQVRVLSRSRREPGDAEPGSGVTYLIGDLAADVGVAEAVADVDVIVHCAGTAKGDREQTRNLVRAARNAGSPHLVYISVIGADRVPQTGRIDRAMYGYFGSKRDAERLITDSGLPWTILRASQFHDLVLTTVSQLAKLPVVPVPSGFRFQPVDADEVAARLVELAMGPPAGLVADFAGPRVYKLDTLVRDYLRAHRRRRPLLPMRMPGAASRAFRDGVNLAPSHAVGRRTWEEFVGQGR